MDADDLKKILDDFYDFCSRMHVRGQVTFTGGNPLLYPHFEAVYRAASQLGFGIAILGNPSPMDRIEQLLDVARPLYFQISLEGLAAHNDFSAAVASDCKLPFCLSIFINCLYCTHRKTHWQQATYPLQSSRHHHQQGPIHSGIACRNTGLKPEWKRVNHAP